MTDQGADDPGALRAKILGLGERSGRKSYYPQLQARLHEMERFRTLLDASTDAILLVELPDGTIRDGNEGACRMLGRAREALCGALLGRVVPAATELVDTLACSAVGARRTFSAHLEQGGGTVLPLEVTADLVAFGDTHYAVLVARDVTERERVGAALRASESRYRAVFDGAAVGLATLDRGGRITDSNAVLEAIVGCDGNALRSAPCAALLDPHDRPAFDAMVAALLEGRVAVQHLLARCRGEGDRARWVRLTCSAMPGESDSCLVVAWQDVSAEQRAEDERGRLLQRLAEANRLKDEFLATVSHELRTPLGPILAWAQMLRSGELAPEEVGPALEAIERNARAQAQLIEDLLDVSRIVSGKLRFTACPVMLAPVLEAAVDSVTPAAVAKGVRVETTFGAGVGALWADAARLQQVIWNLLANAIKFTPHGGRVTISATRSGDRMVIAVCDTGRGIAPEFLPHVFERFRQGPDTVTRAQGGLGLGLAIVRHLVELHGGTVRAESAGSGCGATFTVELPLLPAPHAAAAADGSEPATTP